MFEGDGEGGGYAYGCAPLDVDCEQEMADAHYQAMVEELIASDPQNRSEPSVAEVIALGEAAPVTAGLVCQLIAIDPTTLRTDEQVGLAVAWQRVANYAEAHRGLAVTATVAASPSCDEVPRELAAAGQLGAALGLGSGAADELVTSSLQVAERLPQTQATALAGDLPWRKASSIAMNTIGMTPEQARRVEVKVLPMAWEPLRRGTTRRSVVRSIRSTRSTRTASARTATVTSAWCAITTARGWVSSTRR